MAGVLVVGRPQPCFDHSHLEDLGGGGVAGVRVGLPSLPIRAAVGG